MSEQTVVGLMHPGEMGASIGGALRAAGIAVWWAPEGRSEETRIRAGAAGLDDAGRLETLVAGCHVLLVICPPHAALETAEAVARLGFAGTYVDANAISPATAQRIAATVATGGARFVDGDLIGGPVGPRGSPRLFLSGPEAEAAAVSGLFAATSVSARVIGSGVEASALKMCYAAWTKGTAALVLAIRAMAEASGVGAALDDEWSASQPDLAGRTDAAVAVAGRGWRYAGEMEEIAAAMAACGLPAGFGRAAADIYQRLAGFKGRHPDAKQVIEALR
jgi:3-hydroxyisobutyrate dehydrogenase-like beta-hydroxyacid dehydrogenase